MRPTSVPSLAVHNRWGNVLESDEKTRVTQPVSLLLFDDIDEWKDALEKGRANSFGVGYLNEW